MNNFSQGPAHIHTVSELTKKIKSLLEQNFPFIWLTGEISNFRMPSSLHYYFTLKDDKSQIQAVMFRGQNQHLKFAPENGMAVTGLGRISLYEPRGSYQVILEYLEPKGVGALQAAFEQLKKRLSQEGLFDQEFKKPLPYLPEVIGLATSPTGAVIHDMLQIIQRRFPGQSIDILPVKVQGEGAAHEVASAIELFKKANRVSVIILARGGGSIEDLQAFNDESVARAIFRSDIPIISAIGHETDFTISDFVADIRAPTPSAAAELVVPVFNELNHLLNKNKGIIIDLFNHYIREKRLGLENFAKRLIDPRKKIIDHQLKIDDYSERLFRAYTSLINRHRDLLSRRIDKLIYNSPARYVEKLQQKLEHELNLLSNTYLAVLSEERNRLREMTARLNGLNPTAVLSRGYSIARDISELTIVKDSTTVSIGQKLEVILAKGTLLCDVKERFKNGKKIV
jgi:exodeoxyribonuclease VII large subunit